MPPRKSIADYTVDASLEDDTPDAPLEAAPETVTVTIVAPEPEPLPPLSPRTLAEMEAGRAALARRQQAIAPVQE